MVTALLYLITHERRIGVTIGESEAMTDESEVTTDESTRRRIK